MRYNFKLEAINVVKRIKDSIDYFSKFGKSMKKSYINPIEDKKV